VTYCDFTNDVGEVIIQVKDQRTYKFCVQADGHYPTCELRYIPASNQETITLEMTVIESGEGTNVASTNCASVYYEDKSCSLDVVTYKPYYSICAVLNKTDSMNVTTSTESCSSNSISETFTYALSQDYSSYSIELFLNNVSNGIFYHTNGTKTVNVTIDYNQGSNNGETIKEKIKNNVPLYIFMHLIFVVLGVVGGYMFEKYYNGFGVYGMSLDWQDNMDRAYSDIEGMLQIRLTSMQDATPETKLCQPNELEADGTPCQDDVTSGTFDKDLFVPFASILTIGTNLGS